MNGNCIRVDPNSRRSRMGRVEVVRARLDLTQESLQVDVRVNCSVEWK